MDDIVFAEPSVQLRETLSEDLFAVLSFDKVKDKLRLRESKVLPVVVLARRHSFDVERDRQTHEGRAPEDDGNPPAKLNVAFRRGAGIGGRSETNMDDSNLAHVFQENTLEVDWQTVGWGIIREN